ncbi:hypothetical protein JM658_11920 [Joostella atrarenae]|uniref:Uncharacterized protein n=1 Tax=Joostella atrarenae TaxID=679257 RepID=A0ABS9J510_9FLAO|nr:hypothetical protein [Joostella atrarenae]MCF8715532.1 hypothetical protein [Joostella atrarenae]
MIKDNKKLNIGLGIGLVIIWVSILNKYFHFFDKSEHETTVAYAMNPKVETIGLAKDTFSIDPVIRDPFLGANTQKKFTKKKTKEEYIPVIQKPKPINNVKWPKIQYLGYMKGSESSAKLALIKIDNQLKRIKEGGKYNNIKISKVYKDSIVLIQDNEIIKIFSK